MSKRTMWTLITICAVAAVVAFFVLAVQGVFFETSMQIEDKREKQTGYDDLEVVEIEYDGKTYVIVRWHRASGSDMEVIDVKPSKQE